MSYVNNKDQAWWSEGLMDQRRYRDEAIINKYGLEVYHALTAPVHPSRKAQDIVQLLEYVLQMIEVLDEAIKLDLPNLLFEKDTDLLRGHISCALDWARTLVESLRDSEDKIGGRNVVGS